jgi:hydrogenase nickel incorporation protein HypA/HybF
MHEMSIVEALLVQVRQELASRPDFRVAQVRLRIGALRQVMAETLRFCYDASVRGTSLEGSQLEVEELPAEALCRCCSLTFAVEDHWFECPRCGAAGADLLKGDELQLMSLELAKAG